VSGEQDRGEAGGATAAVETTVELYEDAPVGYLTTGADGRIVRVNRTFCTLSGYRRDELVGKRRFYDLLPPGAKIYYETHYAPLLEMQRSVREIAFELICADGSRLPILVNARMGRPDGGEGPAILITVLDATQRRQYERELLAARAEAESRAAAASALQHVKEAVVLLDPDGRVVVANPAASRLLALPEDAVGVALEDLVPGWAAIAGRIPVERAGAPGGPAVLPLAVAGGTRWIAASGEWSPNGVVFTLRDVTAERRLQELRDDIVAVVSHELRTPVTAVLGAAQTLSGNADALPEEQKAALFEMIVEQSGRLSRILDEILLTRRIDNDELAVDTVRFDVATVVARVVESSRGWRTARPVEVVEVAAVEAVGDPALLEQVVVNLLDNAMKYSPPATPVEVRVTRHRASARITVSNGGPGVAEGDAERIFEKFFRADPTHASGVTGAGLGLFISQELVRRMNGRIGLLRGGPGATFFVDLPTD
jgi:PAS domain S-box-containing protein